jgi:superoxide dismutase, Cu-Zn family
MHSWKWQLLMSACLGLFGCSSQSHAAKAAAAETQASSAVSHAICVLQPVGDSRVTGTVTFEQTPAGVQVHARLAGLEPGEHGFHIHEFGDCSAKDASCAGAHFNPAGLPHGGPDSAKRHAGDLGNILADSQGNAEYQRLDKVIELDGPRSIIGRSIVVHAGRDDLTSQPSGNSGGRSACGVIGIMGATNSQHP